MKAFVDVTKAKLQEKPARPLVQGGSV